MKQQTKRIIAAILVCFTIFGIGAQAKVDAATTLTNEQRIYNYLVGTMKLNTAGACGVLANIEYESNFKLGTISDGGTSYGICQWHRSRWTALKNYCKKNGLDPATLDGQLAYLNYELNTSSYKKILNYIRGVDNTAKGAYNAGHYWCYYYEVPANRASKAVTRGNTAKNKYWNKYKGYNGKTISGTVASTSATPSVTSSKSNTASDSVAFNGSFVRTLRTGAKGDDVKYIQQKLKTLGYSISVDGSYGKGTAAVVKSFQKANGLTADGVCGKATWKAIDSAKAIQVTKVVIKKLPSKLTYKKGASLDTTGMKLKVTYSDGSTKEVTSGFTCTPGGKLSTKGKKKIVVGFGGKTTGYYVTVQ